MQNTECGTGWRCNPDTFKCAWACNARADCPSITDILNFREGEWSEGTFGTDPDFEDQEAFEQWGNAGDPNFVKDRDACAAYGLFRQTLGHFPKLCGVTFDETEKACMLWESDAEGDCDSGTIVAEEGFQSLNEEAIDSLGIPLPGDVTQDETGYDGPNGVLPLSGGRLQCVNQMCVPWPVS